MLKQETAAKRKAREESYLDSLKEALNARESITAKLEKARNSSEMDSLLRELDRLDTSIWTLRKKALPKCE